MTEISGFPAYIPSIVIVVKRDSQALSFDMVEMAIVEVGGLCGQARSNLVHQVVVPLLVHPPGVVRDFGLFWWRRIAPCAELFAEVGKRVGHEIYSGRL